MRKNIFVPTTVLAAMLCVAVSCNLGGKSNYTPHLGVLNPATLNRDSALRLKYTAEGNMAFDSLHVNDTILLWVLGNGFANNLINLGITVTEKNDVRLLQPHDSVVPYFSAASDFTGGKIVFKENTSGMSFPLEFVAQQPREKVKILLTLTSDAQEVSGVSAIQLEFPIKPEL